MGYVEIDLTLVNFENATENNKKNMRKTLEKLKKMREIEKKNGNGDIYGKTIEEYLKHFNDEHMEKKEVADRLRGLKEYLQKLSLNEGDNNQHLTDYSRKETENIDRELEKVNAEIASIEELMKMK